LTDFSDIVDASRYAHVFAFAPAPGEAETIAQPGARCPAPPRESSGHSCQAATASERAGTKTEHRKKAAVAGGSKSKQGGVKQSGQEPLDVQKMDALVMIAKA
jgi:hypothetical protein